MKNVRYKWKSSEKTIKLLKTKTMQEISHKHFKQCQHFPNDIYLFKVNNRNTRTMREICSKLTKKAPERRHWRIFIANFKLISHIVLVFPLLNLNKQMSEGFCCLRLLAVCWYNSQLILNSVLSANFLFGNCKKSYYYKLFLKPGITCRIVKFKYFFFFILLFRLYCLEEKF